MTWFTHPNPNPQLNSVYLCVYVFVCFLFVYLCVGVTEFLRDLVPPRDPSPQFISGAHDQQLIVWSGAALARFTARDGGPTDSTTTTKKCGRKRYKYSTGMNYNYKNANKSMITLPVWANGWTNGGQRRQNLLEIHL